MEAIIKQNWKDLTQILSMKKLVFKFLDSGNGLIIPFSGMTTELKHFVCDLVHISSNQQSLNWISKGPVKNKNAITS